MTGSETKVWVGTVREYLRLALAGAAPEGWSHLPRSEVTLDTKCVVEHSDDDDEADAIADDHGCLRDGLDAASTEGTASWARNLEDPPTDALLLESFLYYLENDAFLPHPGAAAPPALSSEERQREADLLETWC